METFKSSIHKLNGNQIQNEVGTVADCQFLMNTSAKAVKSVTAPEAELVLVD